MGQNLRNIALMIATWPKGRQAGWPTSGITEGRPPLVRGGVEPVPFGAVVGPESRDCSEGANEG